MVHQSCVLLFYHTNPYHLQRTGRTCDLSFFVSRHWLFWELYIPVPSSQWLFYARTLSFYAWFQEHKSHFWYYTIIRSLWMSSCCDNISKTLSITYPMPKLVKKKHQNSFFPPMLKDFQNSNFCLIRFGKTFQKICSENFFIFEQFSQVRIKIKELDYLLKNQHFVKDYKPKFQLVRWKNSQTCYLYYCFFLFLTWAIFIIVTVHNLSSITFVIVYVYVYSFGKFESLKSKLSAYWIENNPRS